MWGAKSHDSVHRQLLKRKESLRVVGGGGQGMGGEGGGGEMEPTSSAYPPNSLPLGQTSSQAFYRYNL